MCNSHDLDYQEIEEPNLINPAKVERLIKSIESHRSGPLLISHNKQRSIRYPATGCFNPGHDEYTISYSELILGVIGEKPIRNEPYLYLTIPLTLPLVCKSLNINELASFPPGLRLDFIRSLGTRLLGDLDKPLHAETLLPYDKAKRNQAITQKKLEIVIGQHEIEQWIASYAEKDIAFAEVYCEMARLLKIPIKADGPLRPSIIILKETLREKSKNLKTLYEEVVNNHPELRKILKDIEKNATLFNNLPETLP